MPYYNNSQTRKENLPCPYDVERFADDHLNPKSIKGDEIIFSHGVPDHEDEDPSVNLNRITGEWYCHPCGRGGYIIGLYAEIMGVTVEEARGFLDENYRLDGDGKKSGDSKASFKIDAIYSYYTLDGKLVYQVVKQNNPKKFRQRKPKEGGGWIWKMTGVEYIPFNLPGVANSNTVSIPEGERDVKNLESIGLTGSCNPGGAGKWKESFNIYFKDKDIIVLPDNDDPGKKHGVDVANNLSGVARSVKVLELQGLPDKGDVSDWIEARKAEGKSGDEIREEFLTLVEQCPEWGKTEEPEMKTTKLPFCFWGYTDKHKLMIRMGELIQHLTNIGYRNFRFNKTDKFKLVKIEHNTITETSLQSIRNDITRQLNEMPEDIFEPGEKQNILDIWAKGIDSYMSSAKLDLLPLFDGKILRDTADKMHFPFGDSVVIVTKDGMKKESYENLPGYIFGNNKIDKNIELFALETLEEEISKQNFAQFIFNICTFKDDKGEEYLDKERVKSLHTCIGYLMYDYVDMAYQKAVVFLDSTPDERSNGGTGKGLLCKAVGQLRKTSLISGKNLDLSNQFSLGVSSMGLDTKLVQFDDIDKKFSSENLFSYITEGYKYEKKHQDAVSFPIEVNPKTVITTNFAMISTGASHDRRFFEFELSDYYNAQRTPESEFNEIFFQWDEEQWNRFYNYMFFCAQKYLQAGARMLPYKSETSTKKKLANALPLEFISYADSLTRNEWLLRKTIVGKYEEVVGEMKLSAKFGKWLKVYCVIKKIELESKYLPERTIDPETKQKTEKREWGYRLKEDEKQ